MDIAPKRLLDNWDRVRAKGPLKFVLTQGVLAWGVSTAIIFLALTTFFVRSGERLEWAITAALVFPALGVLYGLVTWRTCERRYRERHARG